MAHDREAAGVWLDPDAFAATLLSLGLDRYGAAAVNWLPDSWRHAVRVDCGVEIDDHNLHRLMGGCVLLTRPHEFYRSAPGFCDLAGAIAGDGFDHHVWHPPTTAECAWAVVEARLIDPPDRGDPGFSPEVTRLINMIAKEDGFSRLPGVFRSFGVRPDPGVEWPTPNPEFPDVDGDHEADLHAAIRANLEDLATRVAALPLTKSDPRAVAAELLRVVRET